MQHLGFDPENHFRRVCIGTAPQSQGAVVDYGQSEDSPDVPPRVASSSSSRSHRSLHDPTTQVQAHIYLHPHPAPNTSLPPAHPLLSPLDPTLHPAHSAPLQLHSSCSKETQLSPPTIIIIKHQCSRPC